MITSGAGGRRCEVGGEGEDAETRECREEDREGRSEGSEQEVIEEALRRACVRHGSARSGFCPREAIVICRRCWA